VETAKFEMEFKILERLADIERIKEGVKIQDKTLDKLKLELFTLRGLND